MTVKVTKPAINLREELADLRKPTGIAGEAMLRAETPQEQQALIGVGRRNLVTNGDFKIAQRAASATIPRSDSVYVSVDRWNVRAYSAQNFIGTLAQSSDAPKGHKKSLKWTTTTAEIAVSTYELYSVQTRIEAQDLQHLNYGSNDAQEMTLSFWVKSSVTGTYHSLIYQDDGGKLISKTYTINLANTWEYKTVSISGHTASAINDDNTTGLRLEFVVASGTTYQGTTPTGHWEAYTNGKYNALATSNGVVTTANATFYITGVQLELGKVATPFEHRSYGEELAACQRYFFKEDRNVWVSVVNQLSSGLRRASFSHPVTMRAIPTKAATFVVTGGSASASGFDGGNWSSENKTSLYANGVSEAAYVYMHTFSADAEL